MSAEVYQLASHDKMTPEECLAFCNRNSSDFKSVIVIGVGSEDDLILHCSAMTREFGIMLLLDALDYARGKL